MLIAMHLSRQIFSIFSRATFLLHEAYQLNFVANYMFSRKSSKLDEENGIALNQLGLLVQESSPTCALLYFLLADNAPQPFDGAYNNVISLLKRQKELDEENSTAAVLEHCFICFRYVLLIHVLNKIALVLISLGYEAELYLFNARCGSDWEKMRKSTIREIFLKDNLILILSIVEFRIASK